NWLHGDKFLAFNPSSIYRVKARYRKVSGTGTMYIGLAVMDAAKTSYVTAANALAPNMESSNYLLSAANPPLGEWQEKEWIISGKTAGAESGAGTLSDPRKMQGLTGYFAPMAIGNYGSSGVVEIDYVTLEEANEVSAITANTSAITSTNTEMSRIDGVVSGHSTQLTNLTATVDGKADTSALNALTVRVADEEGKSSSQATSITNLTASLSDTDTVAKNALPQVTGLSNYRLFKNVLNYYYATSGSALALVIQTPITFTSKMFKVTIAGYNYTLNRSNINLEVSGYAYNGTSILNHGAINHGTFPLSVKLGVRDSKVVIILLRTVQNWAYPQFSVDAEIGYT
ncbi:MAG: hypothetical protein B7Z24_08455, partial [Pseudomonadales bacterium 32-42-5]